MSAKTYQQRCNCFTQFLQIVGIEGSDSFICEPGSMFLGKDFEGAVWIVRHVEIELYSIRSARVIETIRKLTKAYKKPLASFREEQWRDSEDEESSTCLNSE